MFAKIKECIDRGDKFLVASHIDPDGDAVGSVFSMYWALSFLNKHVTVYLKDPIPYKYTFLKQPPTLASRMPNESFDAVFVLDCGDIFRVGTAYEALEEMGPLINIDHHQTNETFGIVNIIDDKASSTAEILYSLYETLNIPVTFDMALDIYTAILTDTGSFRFENTTPRALSICEKMIRAGASPSHVSQMVYNSHPKERFLLLGHVLTTLATYVHDTVAMVYVNEEMFQMANASRELTDGFVEYIKEIRDTEVAVLFREIPNGYKVSMRSKGTIDVALICNRFGGGGHKNAAGCTIEGSLEEATKRIKEALNIQ